MNEESIYHIKPTEVEHLLLFYCTLQQFPALWIFKLSRLCI